MQQILGSGSVGSTGTRGTTGSVVLSEGDVVSIGSVGSGSVVLSIVSLDDVELSGRVELSIVVELSEGGWGGGSIGIGSGSGSVTLLAGTSKVT